MKLDITSLSYDAKWYDFETGEEIAEKDRKPGRPALKIRPQLLTETNFIIKDGAVIISGESQCKRFKVCLEAWWEIFDANGKPLPCTDDIKQKIYDFQLGGIADFVINKAWSFQEAKAVAEKN